MQLTLPTHTDTNTGQRAHTKQGRLASAVDIIPSLLHTHLSSGGCDFQTVVRGPPGGTQAVSEESVLQNQIMKV
jgi:hypothetical protein